LAGGLKEELKMASGLGLSDLYTTQSKALKAKGPSTGMPLATMIHAELPGKIEAGRRLQDIGFQEQALDQSKSQAEQNLAESKRQFAETSALNEEKFNLQKQQMEDQQDAARTTQAIQLAGLGVQTGLTVGKMASEGAFSGLGESLGWGAAGK
jgi:hypothetical protein